MMTRSLFFSKYSEKSSGDWIHGSEVICSSFLKTCSCCSVEKDWWTQREEKKKEGDHLDDKILG